MKRIIYCCVLILAACSHEEAAFKNSANVLEKSSISSESENQNLTHLEARSSSINVDSELKSYLIHAKVFSKDQKYDVTDTDGGVVYFHETKESDPNKSFLKYWDNDLDFVIDYEKMTAISKSKNLIFYIQDQFDEIPAEEAWMYREAK